MENDTCTRGFFAIELSRETKECLMTYLAYLKKTTTISMRWIKEPQLHLTLRFIDAIPLNQLESVYEDAAKILSNFKPFDITLQQLIAFPIQKPRIIGMGIAPTPELLSLVNALDDGLNHLGYEPEIKLFQPHITLGRVVKPRKRILSLPIFDLPKTQRVNSITLFKSHLTPAGSFYVTLRQFDLAAKEAMSLCP